MNFHRNLSLIYLVLSLTVFLPVTLDSGLSLASDNWQGATGLVVAFLLLAWLHRTVSLSGETRSKKVFSALSVSSLAAYVFVRISLLSCSGWDCLGLFFVGGLGTIVLGSLAIVAGIFAVVRARRAGPVGVVGEGR